MNIPLLTTTRNIDKTEQNSARVTTLFVAPLPQAIYSEPVISNTPLYFQSELLGVRQNIGRIFLSMYDNVIIDHYNFSKEFAKIISRRFLQTISINDGLNTDLVFKKYVTRNFFEYGDFENIDWDFLDQLTEGLFSESQLKDFYRESRDFIINNISNIPEVLDKNAYGNFDTEIRKSVSDEFGLDYIKL